MTLLEIRTHFVELSGRLDLVNDTNSYANATVGLGADFFIQAGQRFLDAKYGNPNENVRDINTLPLNTIEFVVPQRYRTVERVLFKNTSDVWIDLELIGMDQVWEDYEIDDLTTMTGADVPKFYAFAIKRDIDDTATVAIESQQYLYILPKVTVNVSIQIVGKAFARKMDTNTDVSFWSVNYPDVLIQSAMYSIERFYRNTQGMQDHLFAIEEDLAHVDFDMVEQKLATIDTMGNAF